MGGVVVLLSGRERKGAGRVKCDEGRVKRVRVCVCG